MGLNDLYGFELVPVADGSIISEEKWTHIQHLLLHMQPAKSVSLVGDPPRAIRVLCYGGTEVAPGLLKKVSDLAGTSLRVVPG
jgi:hypothetical protein